MFLNYKHEENLVFLDDYAFFIEALINLYSTDADATWLKMALKLTNEAILKFKSDKEDFLYYSNTKSNKLFHNYKEINDNVIPSSNSTFMLNLFRLGIILDNFKFNEIANRSLSLISNKINSSPLFYAKWLKLSLLSQKEVFKVKIVGKRDSEYRKILNEGFFPNIHFLSNDKNIEKKLNKFKNKDEKTLIYLCGKDFCFEPIHDIETCIELIENKS